MQEAPHPTPCRAPARVRVVGFGLFPRALLAVCTQVLRQQARSTESQPSVQGCSRQEHRV